MEIKTGDEIVSAISKAQEQGFEDDGILLKSLSWEKWVSVESFLSALNTIESCEVKKAESVISILRNKLRDESGGE